MVAEFGNSATELCQIFHFTTPSILLYFRKFFQRDLIDLLPDLGTEDKDHTLLNYIVSTSTTWISTKNGLNRSIFTGSGRLLFSESSTPVL